MFSPPSPVLEMYLASVFGSPPSTWHALPEYPRGRIVFRRCRWLQLVALLVLAARRSTLTKTVTVNGAVIGIIDTICYTVPVAVIAEDSWLYAPISLCVSSSHSVVPTLPIKRRLGSKAGYVHLIHPL